MRTNSRTKKQSGSRTRSIIRNLACISFALLVITCCLIMHAHVSPVEAAANQPIMKSSEVKAGMRGYGLTVFKGTQVEKFPIVVMGKLKSYLGESDLILVRVLGGYPVEHGTGVIAGMSGSPIYIDGKLIGAIGYGWGFSKEPIGGVTPIEHMLRELPGKPQNNQVSSAKLPDREFMLDNPLSIDGIDYKKVMIRETYLPEQQKSPGGTMVLTPVPAMLQVSGFSSGSIEMIREKLKPYGIVPMAVPGGSSRSNHPVPEIVPGSAIGVTMIDGDLFMGGAGTVSYRDGNRILAFAHPMMQLGSTDIPLHAAYIEGIMPSLQRPFKFSSSLGIVGTMQQDRMYAIGGTLGVKPPMIPVRVNLNDAERGKNRSYNLRVINHKYLTPWFLTMAGYESLATTATSLNDCSVVIRYTIQLKDHPVLQFEDHISGNNIQADVGTQLMSYMSALTPVDHNPPKIEQVTLDIKMNAKNNTAYIRDVTTQYRRVRPGDKLDIAVRLQAPGNEVLVKQVEIPVPSDLKKGAVKIAVAGGRHMDALRRRLHIQDSRPENIKQVIDRVRKKERNNHLVIQAIYPRKTVVFSGERLNNLPASKQSLFTSSPRSSIAESLDTYTSIVELPHDIEGFGIIDVMLSGEVPAAQDSFDAAKPDVPPKSPDTPVDSSPKTDTLDEIRIPESSGIDAGKLRGERARKLMDEDITVFNVAAAAKPDASKDAKPSASKALSTGSNVASLSSAQDYFLGKFKNTSITNGSITLGHSLAKIYESSSTFIMDIEVDPRNGTVYAVESPSGNLLEFKEYHPPTIIGKTGEPLVPCIVRADNGTIYVGTGGSGRIYRKIPGKTMDLFVTLKDDIVWDMLLEPDGSLIAATGNSGRVYRISPEGKTKVLFDAPEFHVMSLERKPDGSIFAGCANEGTVYVISPEGKVSPFFRTLGQSIETMLYDDGHLWIGSDELLYRISTSGNTGQKVYIFPEAAVVSLVKDSQGSILAGTSDLGRVYRVTGDTFENLYESEMNQVLALKIDKHGDVLLGTGNPGKVARLKNAYESEGTYISRVIDTGRMSEFGRIQWMTTTPQGTELSLQTRSGNTPTPDSTWSDWSIPCTLTEGQQVSSPAARYVQVKAVLKSSGSEKTPILHNVNIYYRHQASAPLLEFESPRGGENLSGTADVKWKAFATNPQVLTYSVFSSSDEGKTWKPIKENIDASVDARKASGATGDSMLKESTKWSTRQIPDGRYVIKVKGFDRTNPDNNNLTREIISKPVVVCNKKPEITITGSDVEGNRALIRGFAKTGIANVKEVAYKIDTGEWKVAFPEDGIFDDNREKFVIYLNSPYRSKFKLTVKATDEAGNSHEISRNMQLATPKRDSRASEDKDENKTDTNLEQTTEKSRNSSENTDETDE